MVIFRKLKCVVRQNPEISFNFLGILNSIKSRKKKKKQKEKETFLSFKNWRIISFQDDAFPEAFVWFCIILQGLFNSYIILLKLLGIEFFLSLF